jgi:hypothetical protein
MMAAELEDIDRRFLDLRDTRDALIAGYARKYAVGNELAEKLDAARFLAALETLRPTGFGFRDAFTRGAVFAPHIETTCTEALASSGITTAADLQAALNNEACRAAIESYASLMDVAAEEISHFAVAVIAAGFANARRVCSSFSRSA